MGTGVVSPPKLRMSDRASKGCRLNTMSRSFYKQSNVQDALGSQVMREALAQGR